MKGGTTISLLTNKLFLIVCIPLAAWFIGNVWEAAATLAQERSYEALYLFIRQVVLLVGGSDHLVYESVIQIQQSTGTYEALHELQLIVGGTFVTIILILALWNLLKITASGSYESWNVFARVVMIVVVIGGVGLFQTLITFLSTGTLFLPFHGLIELGKYMAISGAEFSKWLLTGGVG